MHHPLDEDKIRITVECAKKSRSAFRELYQIFFPRVFAFVAYRVGKKQDTEDLVSESFIKAIRRIADFEHRGDGSFSAWLFQIVRNEVNTFFRRNHHHSGAISLEDVPDIATATSLPDDALLRKEQFIRLRKQISTLSTRRQEVILLKYYGGMRNQEIALVLSLDERTVASHLSRGLNDLQNLMREEEVYTQ